MLVKMLQTRGFCKEGQIVDLPDERAQKLIDEKSAEKFIKPAPKKATAKGDK